jgi:hypothetical protein
MAFLALFFRGDFLSVGGETLFGFGFFFGGITCGAFKDYNRLASSSLGIARQNCFKILSCDLVSAAD